jgi:hypothetical protein
MVTTLLALVLLGGAPRQPVLAHWVSHHDLPPPTRPWSEDAENPDFVLYDDGLVLTRRGAGASRLAVTLSRAERAALEALAGAEFFSLPDAIQGTGGLHPPVHLVTRWANGRRKTVRLMGALGDEAVRAKVPPGLLEVLDAITSFQRTDATPWVPEALVVRACPTKAAAKGAWPASWPAPQAGQRVAVLEDCTQHRIAASERARAERLTRSGGPWGVVSHAGAAWLVTLSREALPAEEAWAGR